MKPDARNTALVAPSHPALPREGHFVPIYIAADAREDGGGTYTTWAVWVPGGCIRLLSMKVLTMKEFVICRIH